MWSCRTIVLRMLYPSRRIVLRCASLPSPPLRGGRGDSTNRPVLGGDGRGIGADDFGERIAPGAQQRRGKIVLDGIDQPKALVDQRRIKLDQAGAGADFCQRGAAGVDTTDPYQRKRALGANVSLG